jgi:hypothetical protein
MRDGRATSPTMTGSIKEFTKRSLRELETFCHRLSAGAMEEVRASHPGAPSAPCSVWPTKSRA